MRRSTKKTKSRAISLTVTAIATAVFSAWSPSSWAVDPFVVRDIRVEGVQRTEPGTVFSYLPFKVGDTYTDEKGASAIRALFATGFFRDVRLEANGDVLIVIVEERPSIATITFNGNKEFDTDKLKGALRDIGIAEARVLDRSLLERAEQELKRLYLSRGKYGVQITTTVTPQERNRVAIDFNFDEGEVASIKQINIVGNKAFSTRELLSQIELTTPGWFTFFTKRDQYSKEKLTADLETLRSYYLNRGYLEFSIDSTQVSITPDKRDIYITINVSEGQKYTVSDVKLTGELLDKEAELKSLVLLKPGDTFSGERLNESTRLITERLGNYGYAFANATPAPEINREKATVAFSIVVDPARRVYVRRINIAGNARSRDEVIRRELRQVESGYFNGERVRASRDRVDRLGYFDEVKVETPAVPNAPDLVDVNYTVKERATGSLNFGAGFSSSEKVVLNASISQNNLFGSGNSLSFEVNTSRSSQVYALSQNNPYYTIDGVSQGFDVYTRKYDPTELSSSLGNYKLRSTGGGLRFGIPVGEATSIIVGTAYESTNLQVFDSTPTNRGSPQRFKDYVQQFGSNSSAVLVNAAWVRDTRDSGISPRKGTLQRASAEVTLPVLDLRYYRLSYQHQWYRPLGEDFTIALNGQTDYGRGFGGKPLPVFKYYYAGGIGTVRGYEAGSLTTRYDEVDGASLGGSTRLFGNAEFLFAIPGVQDKSVRAFLFTDGGTTWPEGDHVSLGDLRYSAGLGISWLSPVGPLKVSFGKPLNAKPGDRTQLFQFQLGTGF
ncbi:MAG TPA: outer membrane protein assembly factor BamA [Burkholderiaceae bacterium]|nr:outer membrane protein assembly factor BamA [Burkholderiaceae bacterium]